MAYRVWTEIECRDCSRTVARHSITGFTVPRRDMAREATQAGWQLTNGDWVCPDHAAPATRPDRNGFTTGDPA